MKHLSILAAIILAAAALVASFQNCYACTGITLKAKDGGTVVARTIEWAASDNDCRWVVVPRGHGWKSFIPGGGTGRSFTNEYGYVGVSVVQDELMMEIPIGAQFPVDETPADIPSATQCTCVTDMSGLKFYYRSMYDGGIRCIDLKEIDFKKIGLKSEPLVPSKKEFVHHIRF